MIARLRGTLVARTVDGLVLDVNGVGYLVQTTPSAAGKGGDEITVETYLHVREDAMQLYGFADAAERELFVQLLGVNGVGPKVALAIVSGSRPAELSYVVGGTEPTHWVWTGEQYELLEHISAEEDKVQEEGDTAQ